MTARHRVSKMLLRHGRVYPESSTWTVAHRRWLARQQFQEGVSDLVFADLIASVDGLTARKAAIAERLSRLARDEAWWPTVGRLRCFRGVDTLTAFALHLELGGDWQRFGRANAVSAWLGLIPSLHQRRSPDSSVTSRVSPTRNVAYPSLTARVIVICQTYTLHLPLCYSSSAAHESPTTAHRYVH